MLAKKFLMAALVAGLGLCSASISSAEQVHYVFQVPLKGVTSAAPGSTTLPPPSSSVPQYEWIDQSQECPLGQEGSITWQEIFEVSPVYRTTGQTRDYTDTCKVPLGIPVLSGPSSAYPGAGYAATWTAVPVATRYELRLSDGQTEGTVYNGPDTTAPRVASMTVGQVDQLWARACDATRCGDWSAPHSVTVVNPGAPAAPALDAPATVIDGGNINLAWTPVFSPGGYPLYYEVVYNKGAGNVSVYSGTGTSATITNASPAGTTYTSQVRACDTYGCSGWTQATTVVNPPIPATPTFTGTPSTAYPDASYVVKWSSATGATRYELSSWDDAVGNPAVVYTGSGVSFTATASGTVGQIQAYAVRACNVSGCSGVQPQQNVKVVSPSAPAAPTISAPSTVIAGGNVTVTWSSSSSPGGYALHYELVTNKDGGAATQVYSGGATSATGVSNASPAGSTYGFGIRACDTYNCSGYAWTSTLVQAPIPATPAPNAPANVWPGQGFTVSWNSVGGATRYDLYQWDNVTKDTVYSGAGTSFARVANGAVGFVHQFQVRSCNATGCSDWSAPVSVTVVNPTAPATPSVLNAPAAVIAGGSIPLSWSASSSPGGYALRYEVVYNLHQGGADVAVYSGAGTSAAIANANPAGVTYTSYVRACDTYNCSGWRSAATAVQPPVPAAPTLSGGASQAYPGEGFALAWTGASYATRYELYQRDAGHDGVVWSANATSIWTSASNVGTTEYWIRACNATGCSGWSNQVNVNIISPVPATPGRLSATATVYPGNQVAVSWGGVSGATSYNLRVRYSGVDTVLTYGSTSTTGTAGAVGTVYTYNVQACNAAGCSGWSGSVTATVVAPPVPATPALTAPGGVSAGLPINISWSAVSGTTYYQLLGDAGTTASTLRYQGASRSYSIPTAMNRRDSSYTVSVRACNDSGCSGWRTQTVMIYGSG